MLKKCFMVLFILLAHAVSFSQINNSMIKLSDNVELIKLSDNTYIHVSYADLPQWGRVSANGLILIDKEQAFLFDTPWNNKDTEDLYRWITDSMHLELAGFIPNHWHEDCMGGLEFLRERNVPSYANQMTIELAMLNGLPVPENSFSDSLELNFGGKLIQCYYLGSAHSTDNIVVWIPSEQILFPACIVKSMGSKNLGNTADGDLEAYPNTLIKIIEKFSAALYVIPGHGPYGGMELVRHTLELTGN